MGRSEGGRGEGYASVRPGTLLLSCGEGQRGCLKTGLCSNELETRAAGVKARQGLGQGKGWGTAGAGARQGLGHGRGWGKGWGKA